MVEVINGVKICVRLIVRAVRAQIFKMGLLL